MLVVETPMIDLKCKVDRDISTAKAGAIEGWRALALLMAAFVMLGWVVCRGLV